MEKRPPELVGIGHIVNEMIYFPGRTVGPVLGSPPAYSLVAAARLGIRSGIVTRIGGDFPKELLNAFAESGVDTGGIHVSARSTCSELIYDGHGNKEIRLTSVAEPITAQDVPEQYKGCDVVYVCTMSDDVPLDQLGVIAEYGVNSAIDLGGYGGVHMSNDRRSEINRVSDFARQAASWFDFVKASDEDCQAIFGKESPESYVHTLLSGKTKAVLITRGEQGVTLGIPDGIYTVPALKGNPMDVTGGGDTFMAGFLSEYIRSGDILRSVVFGSATALCVIERTGGVTPQRMPAEQEVRNRLSTVDLSSMVGKMVFNGNPNQEIHCG